MKADPLAKIWNERNKDDGEPYKKYVIDPILLGLIGDVNNKTILDQGCGNGCLSKKISALKPDKIVMLDLFPGNLSYAKKNLSPSKTPVETICADLNKKLFIKSEQFDLIVSSMVLSEIKNLKLPSRRLLEF